MLRFRFRRRRCRCSGSDSQMPLSLLPPNVSCCAATLGCQAQIRHNQKKKKKKKIYNHRKNNYNIKFLHYINFSLLFLHIFLGMIEVK